MSGSNGQHQSNPTAKDGPMQAAQRASRPHAPRRFYREASPKLESDGSYRLHLDGRPARTPGGAYLNVPGERAAAALAAEWNVQGKTLDFPSMPLTRLLNAAIDGVSARLDDVRAELVRFVGADLLCYRAEGPVGLAARQEEHWSPVLDWLEAETGARLKVVKGVMPVTQDRKALTAIRKALVDLDAFHLTGLHSAAGLTRSFTLAFALFRKRLDADAVWAAAHVDEDWQIAEWGIDLEAEARRHRQRLELDAAVLLLDAQVYKERPEL